jgi:hypothetical protein
VDSYAGNLFEDPDIWNCGSLVSLRRDLRDGVVPARCRGCDWLYDEPIKI